jgi:chemotaxis signal transduction protein
MGTSTPEEHLAAEGAPTVVAEAPPTVADEAPPTVRACVFTLAGEPFAVGLEVAREILTIEECTPVPLAPPAVLGVVNLRGTLVPVVDLRPVLRLPAASGRPTLALVLATESLRFAVAIDAVVGLASLDEVPPLRATASRRFGGCGLAVVRMGESLPTLLDAGRVARTVMAQAGATGRGPARRHES